MNHTKRSALALALALIWIAPISSWADGPSPLGVAQCMLSAGPLGAINCAIAAQNAEASAQVRAQNEAKALAMAEYVRIHQNDGFDPVNCTDNGLPLSDLICEIKRKKAEQAAQARAESRAAWMASKDMRDSARREAGFDPTNDYAARLDDCLNSTGVRIPDGHCDALRAAANKDAQGRLDNAARIKKNDADRTRAAAAERARVAALPPPPPPPPPPTGHHHWTWHERSEYGYPRELSPNDRAAGLASAPLLLIRRVASSSSYGFMAPTDRFTMECAEPCENMEITGFDGGRRVMPITRGSVLWAIVEDARHGWIR